jgi:hypothetical protein
LPCSVYNRKYPTLREEHRVRVFKNTVLRRIFEPKRDRVVGGWRKLHDEEFHKLYSSLSIMRMVKSKRIKWAGHLARMRKKNSNKILVGKPERKKPLRRHRRRWKDNIKIDLREDGVVWTGLMWLKIGISGGLL